MSLSCGFYESLNHDRKYDNTQLSRLFNNLINDGVFENVGNHFVVHAVSGNDITVGTGFAWFNSTFTYNDALLPLTCTPAHVLLDRIDTVVLEVDSTQSVRANTIKMVNGVASSSAVAATLTNTDKIHQYPLCYISRAGGSSGITQANITNCIGTNAMPFITGILQTVSIDSLLGQWQAGLNEFEAAQQTAFNTWFDTIKGQLSEDAAGQLQQAINELGNQLQQAINELGNQLPSRSMSNTITNLTWIDLNGDMSKPYMQPCSVATDDASTLIGSPVTSGCFYAHREVFVINNANGNKYILVKVTEIYPYIGRIWTNLYNTDTSLWGIWVANCTGGFKFGKDENGRYGYYKDGADSVTPFSGNAQKKDIVAGVTTYTFDRDVVGYSMRAVKGNTVHIDSYLNGEYLFGWLNKSNTSDRYIGTNTNNGYGIISGKTITIDNATFPSGYIIAYFE